MEFAPKVVFLRRLLMQLRLALREPRWKVRDWKNQRVAALGLKPTCVRQQKGVRVVEGPGARLRVRRAPLQIPQRADDAALAEICWQTVSGEWWIGKGPDNAVACRCPGIVGCRLLVGEHLGD